MSWKQRAGQTDPNTSSCNASLHFAHKDMLLTNDFLISGQYHFCEIKDKEQRRMILSHMRYNSPVDCKAEQGDSDGRETERKGRAGKV